jgi:hypothetical protein
MQVLYQTKAGEVIPVDMSTGSTVFMTPTNKAFSQHFNRTSFTVTPNVILAMIGYVHAPPSGPGQSFGFHTFITTTSLLTFTYNVSTFGYGVVDLHYLYLAIQYETSTYFMGIISQTCNFHSN